ncbi:MAG TPA: alkaline phosphatase family protein, partial [Polyangiaceae bacterium]
MKKRIFSLLVSALYVLGTVFGGLYLFLKPPPPPELKSPAVAHAPLTRHLLLVIVDGLRFDVATDPALMPRFSEAMQSHRSAEILAGRVSMTSSAVQNYGTGQPGGFEQIARNANPDPARFSNWLNNAAQQGLVLGVMGDDAWVEMYRDSFRFQRRNPPGVAIDYDFNEQSFASGRELLRKSPDFLILHFGTPDHQGHAYGIRSERYRRHIQNYDRLLFELLAEVGPEWTVIVTSDHGAADSGTHGANVLVQRRSPLFAYGPGISSERVASEPLDQADLAGTFAALLGVPAAAHSLGHLLVDWLALPDAERARLACADAERSLSLAQASNLDESRELSERLAHACAPERAPEEAKRGARAVVSEVARLLTLRQGVASPRAVSFVLFSLLGAILLAHLLLEQVPFRSFLPGACMAALAVVLVAGVEHLPGTWPKRADGALFVLAACPLLWFLLRPEQVLAVFNRRIALASALAPGALAVCYPTNLQPMAFALLLLLGIVTLSSRSPGQWGAVIAAGSRRGRLADLLLLAAWGALLVPAGTHADNIYAFSWLGDVR